MKYLSSFFAIVVLLVFSASCEKEFTPETTFEEPNIVVEGYIYAADNALPPYVILTRSIEYSSSIGLDALNNLFVHDATVTISDGTNEAQLPELCVSDLAILPPFLQEAIANAIGIPAAAIQDEGLDVCVYADILGAIGLSGISPTVGGTYDLTIISNEFDTVTATTTIPAPVPLDSLTYQSHPDPKNDSLVEVLGYFQDPADQANYYRIFSQRNEEPMYASGSRGTNGSVSDDNIFNGQSFRFNIVRGQDPLGDFDFDTFGYFWKGDTVTVRTASLDYEHFRFWQTLEYNTGSQGPFGSYTRIESNINGGLGIWGGMSYTDYTIIIPK